MKNQPKKQITRRLSAVILSAILVFCMVPMSVSVSAGSLDNGLEYKITDGEVTITGCDESVTEVVIPQEIEGYSVTSIGDEAFAGCEILTSIKIPEGVTSIGYGGFYCCFSLTSITIPDSVTSIGDYAFGECESLTSIIIPTGVTSIGDHTFYHCISLTSITIPESVTSMYDYAFYCCYDLETVYYGGSEEQWEQIEIGLDNECLTNANIIFAKEDEPVYEKGDLDGDGELSASDSLFMRQYLSGRISLDSFFDPSLADLNGDGAVNAKDHLMLRIALAS